MTRKPHCSSFIMRRTTTLTAESEDARLVDKGHGRCWVAKAVSAPGAQLAAVGRAQQPRGSQQPWAACLQAPAYRQLQIRLQDRPASAPAMHFSWCCLH